MTAERIVVNVLVEKPLERVWNSWTEPEDIKLWNIPFPKWHCPVVINDVREDGAFFFRMESRDGKEGFDHTGRYDKVVPYEAIEYTLNDGRKSTIEFQQIDRNTIVRESFEPEQSVPNDLQRDFCQSVLHRFKEYVEKE